MMSAREKIAYIRGLLDAGKPEDKLALSLYSAIVEALDALADEVEEVNEGLTEQRDVTEELFSICEELDSDLSDVESKFDDEADEEDADFDDEYKEITCPSCGLHFFYHPSMLAEESSVTCPDCECVIPVDPEKKTDDLDG